MWITRALPGALSTAALVEEAGLAPLVAPVLTFESLTAPPITLDIGEALAFTSVQGVREAAKRLQERDVAVYAVGDVTAAAARAEGFSLVASASGDVVALIDLILHSPPLGGVLHPGALETAGDLIGTLRARGLKARKLALYRTRPLSALPQRVQDAFALNALAAVLIHSPKGGRVVADLLSKDQLCFSAVTAYGLSEACLAPVKESGFKAVVCAAIPAESALLVALKSQGRSAHDTI